MLWDIPLTKMHMDDQKLNALMESWKHEASADPEFAARVRSRIHEAYFAKEHASDARHPSFAWWRGWAGYGLGLAGGLCTLVLGAAVFFSLQKGTLPTDPALPSHYRSLIEPAAFVRNQMERSGGFEALNPGWEPLRAGMRDTLVRVERAVDLSPAQFREFEALHVDYLGRFEAVYAELIGLENAYREFERQRIAGEDVNLWAVYDHMRSQKACFEKALELQQVFLTEVMGLMKPEQRQRYHDLIQAANPSPIPPSAFQAALKRERPI
jgi:hypothetical protein